MLQVRTGEGSSNLPAAHHVVTYHTFSPQKPARTFGHQWKPSMCTSRPEPLGLTGEKAAISTSLTRHWSTDQCGYYDCPIEKDKAWNKKLQAKSESKQRTCRSKPVLNPSKDLVQNKFSPPQPLDCTVKTNSNIRHLKITKITERLKADQALPFDQEEQI